LVGVISLKRKAAGRGSLLEMAFTMIDKASSGVGLGIFWVKGTRQTIAPLKPILSLQIPSMPIGISRSVRTAVRGCDTLPSIRLTVAMKF